MVLEKIIASENRKIVKNVLKTLLLIKLGLAAIAFSLVSRYEKPDWYEIEWERMQECSQRKGDKPYYLKLNWPLNDGFPCQKSSKGCRGAYIPAINTIIISEDYIQEKTLLRHEMLHALRIEHGAFLDRMDNGAFSDVMGNEEFLERCGAYLNENKPDPSR